MENLNPDPQAHVEPLFSTDGSTAVPEETTPAATGTTATAETADHSRTLGTYELLRSQSRTDSAADDNDVTSEILSRPRRSVWDC